MTCGWFLVFVANKYCAPAPFMSVLLNSPKPVMMDDSAGVQRKEPWGLLPHHCANGPCTCLRQTINSCLAWQLRLSELTFHCFPNQLSEIYPWLLLELNQNKKKIGNGDEIYRCSMFLFYSACCCLNAIVNTPKEWWDRIRDGLVFSLPSSNQSQEK